MQIGSSSRSEYLSFRLRTCAYLANWLRVTSFGRWLQTDNFNIIGDCFKVFDSLVTRVTESLVPKSLVRSALLAYIRGYKGCVCCRRSIILNNKQTVNSLRRSYNFSAWAPSSNILGLAVVKKPLLFYLQVGIKLV